PHGEGNVRLRSEEALGVEVPLGLLQAEGDHPGGRGFPAAGEEQLRAGQEISALTRKRAGIVTALALAIIALACGAYLFTRPAAPTAPETASCKKSTCGPLELLDCGVAFDGPLFVYVRFTGNYLGDCGRSGATLYNPAFCRTVSRVTDF